MCSGHLPGPLRGRARCSTCSRTVGRRNHAIADQFGLSEKTERNHLSSILTKLQVSDRVVTIVRAREAGLGAGLLPD